MKKDLFILGAGGHGEIVYDIAIKMNIFEEIYFLDDNKNKKITNEQLKGDISEKTFKNIKKEKSLFITAFGDNFLRKVYHKLLRDNKLEITKLIHPFSSVSKSSYIAKGSVICAGSIVGPNTSIGEGCIINHCASVDHDCVIDDFVHISPQVGIAGNVLIGSLTHIGIGSSIIQGINIGSNCLIGSGSNVIKNIKKDIKVYGNPASKAK